MNSKILLALSLASCTAYYPVGHWGDGDMSAANDAASVADLSTRDLSAVNDVGVSELSSVADLPHMQDLSLCRGVSECLPGQTEIVGCSQKVCGPNCRWRLALVTVPGNECGTPNMQTCDAGPGCPGLGHQGCLSAPVCKWEKCRCI